MADRPNKSPNFAQTAAKVAQAAKLARGAFFAILALIVVFMTIFFFASFQKYENNKDGWSLYYPRGWEVKEDLPAGGIVVFLAKKQNTLDFFQDNISITYLKLRTPLTLNEYVDLTKKQMTQTFSDIKVAQSSLVDISGHPGTRLLFQATGDMKLTFVSYAFLVDDMAYNITYAAMTEHYEKTGRLLFEIVMATLRVMF